MKQIQINTIVVSSVILLWLFFRKEKEAAAAEIPEREEALVVMEEGMEEGLAPPSIMPTIPTDRGIMVEEVLEPEYEEDRIFIQYPGLDIWIPRK